MWASEIVLTHSSRCPGKESELVSMLAILAEQKRNNVQQRNQTTPYAPPISSGAGKV
jgi:hypothetical protein